MALTRFLTIEAIEGEQSSTRRAEVSKRNSYYYQHDYRSTTYCIVVSK